MSRTRNNAASDAMVGAGSLCTLVAGMSVISPDIRTQVTAFAGDPGVQLGALASRVMEYGNMVTRLAGDYTPDSTAFMGFAIVAVFLTFMMFRS